MSLSNVLTQTTRVTIILTSMAKQCSVSNLKLRSINFSNLLLTSNDLDDLEGNLDSEKVKLEDFKLKTGKPGNSFLVPLFEVKDKDGNEIDPEFIELINLNKIVLNDDLIVNEKSGFCAGICLKQDSWVIYADNLISTGVFIFKNPATTKLNFYLLLTMLPPTKLHLEGDRLKLNNMELNCIRFDVRKKMTTRSIFLKANKNDITEKYVLRFPNDLEKIIFSSDSTKLGPFTYSDDNFEDKYAVIKPRSVYEGDSLLRCSHLRDYKSGTLKEENIESEEPLQLIVGEQNKPANVETERSTSLKEKPAAIKKDYQPIMDNSETIGKKFIYIEEALIKSMIKELKNNTEALKLIGDELKSFRESVLKSR
ncbi:hypothetical protein CDIK_1610 [Cucumispora dikerogammari]|nr:hypothetical protein CDIK_1610 [Cucumispora dikerogammari]